jgi:hypothetical protein
MTALEGSLSIMPHTMIFIVVSGCYLRGESGVSLLLSINNRRSGILSYGDLVNASSATHQSKKKRKQ